MMTHLQSRQLGNFSIDIDAYDYRTQDPGEVHRRIMAELASKRKGIILFHDIQPSTARALPGLLAAMKAQGFRVVHIVPTAPVQTLAEFDTIARGGKPKQVASAQPIEPAPPPLPQRSLYRTVAAATAGAGVCAIVAAATNCGCTATTRSHSAASAGARTASARCPSASGTGLARCDFRALIG